MEHIGKLILRIGMGGMMLPHGIQKLGTFFSGEEIHFVNPLGIGEIPTLILAVIAELVCASMILVGFHTRWAAVLPMITMLVAAFIVHAGDPWGRKEFALLYFTGYAAIFFLGGGKYGLDKGK